MSQRDAALQSIRQLVFSGQIPVGVRTSERLLTENFLAAQGLGRTPVREALAILTERGVIEQYPQSGFAVVHVSAYEAQKVLQLQKITEEVMVAEACRQKASIFPADVQALVSSLEEDAQKGDSPKFLDSARLFHIILAGDSGYASAVDAIGGFRDRLALFFAARPLKKKEQMVLLLAYRQLVEGIASCEVSVAKGSLDRLIFQELSSVLSRPQV